MNFVVITSFGTVDQEVHGPMAEQDAVRLKELFESSNPGFSLSSGNHIVAPRLAAVIPWAENTT